MGGSSSFVGTISKLPELGVMIILLFLFQHLNLLVVVANSPAYLKPQKASCHKEERSALLQFFNSTSAQYSPCKPAHLGESSDCCSWDGVECDQKTGHVIGLSMTECNFSGLVPSSLGNLRHLASLDLSYNSLSGPVPSSLGNLRHLASLDLSYNSLSGPIPAASLANLTQLTSLALDHNQFNGSIPPSLGNLTQLLVLWMNSNRLTGPIPSSIGNLSSLTDLYLGTNNLNGSIPHSFSNLINLQLLSLDNNNLSGRVDFYMMFQSLEYLNNVDLSSNKLEVLIEPRNVNASLLPKFSYIGLGSCGLREFPDFLRYQDELTHLDLSGNKLQGLVPKWLSKMGTETLWLLNLSYNFLSGFDLPRGGLVLPWSNLAVVYLSSNMLQKLPVPPPNTEYYGIADNRLTGEMPPFVCNLSSLQNLDLSNNRLSGELPWCLGNFSLDLQVLNLGNNSFHGVLPPTFSKLSNLTMIDVSNNRLRGQLPRSLANCVQLQFLVLSNNEFTDVFPFWLGTLPELKLLAMRHNRFYHVIGRKLENHHGFPKLLVIDLSYNNFTGEFPTEYIFSGKSMRSNTLSPPAYVNASMLSVNFDFSVTITNKGVDRYFAKINGDFRSIDLSSNKFDGEIPEYIGKLKGLRSLNVSNNLLTGSIPSFLGNLTVLESLDFSQNKLSGQIPQKLTQLTFLSQFNVSNNNLTGPIPPGAQLTSFHISSYEGNPGLCGDPLPKKCGNPKAPQLPPPSSSEDNGSRSDGLFDFDWKFVLAGCGSGFIVGVVLADVVVTRRQELFLQIVGMVRLTISKTESWGRRRN